MDHQLWLATTCFFLFGVKNREDKLKKNTQHLKNQGYFNFLNGVGTKKFATTRIMKSTSAAPGFGLHKIIFEYLEEEETHEIMKYTKIS